MAESAASIIRDLATDLGLAVVPGGPLARAQAAIEGLVGPGTEDAREAVMKLYDRPPDERRADSPECMCDDSDYRDEVCVWHLTRALTAYAGARVQAERALCMRDVCFDCDEGREVFLLNEAGEAAGPGEAASWCHRDDARAWWVCDAANIRQRATPPGGEGGTS